MSGNVVPLRVSDAELSDAWVEYDQARISLETMYADPQTTSRDRFAAALEAFRLWRRFADLARRAAI